MQIVNNNKINKMYYYQILINGNNLTVCQKWFKLIIKNNMIGKNNIFNK